MKKITSLALALVMMLIQIPAFGAGQVSLNAYSADEMRVPWFGEGVDWLPGSGLGLLTLETPELVLSDGYCVTGITENSVMRLDGVDFGDPGPAKAYLRANTGNETGFTMEVRLDSADGALLGTFTRTGPTEEGWTSGTDQVSAEFEITEEATGVHTLYFVNKTGAMNFFGVHFDQK
ncbi:MAG TPA: carbohydrate-binding protein, partial [Firmicutes bacterium]|nr:carbohydrate-binding protein [Bacillota bacterium]